MSDRAANCVLGDKDGSKRRGEEETPSWLSALFWDRSWFGVWRKKKGKLVKKEIKV